MKRWMALCLCIVMLLSFSSCQQAPTPSKEQMVSTTASTVTKTTTVAVTTTTATKVDQDGEEEQTPGSTPLFYKATDDDGDTVWLLGTIHVAKEEMYPLPSYIYDAYSNAQALAVEFDTVAYETNFDLIGKMMSSWLCEKSGHIYDYISEELYTDAKDVLKDLGIYTQLFDRYYPVVWWSFIDSGMILRTEYTSELGIDNHFLARAYEEGKDILEIESAEFQNDMMLQFSPELQAHLLEQSVKTYDDPDAFTSLDDMVNLWRAGDEERFETYLASEDDGIDSQEERALYEEYNNAILVERNIVMTDFAEDCLKNGEDVFICVGAAHIVGEGAMVDLLRERGYTVELVK